MRLIDLQTNTVLEQPSDVAEKLLRAGTHTVSQGDSFFVQDPVSQSIERINAPDLFKQLDLGKTLLPDALIKKNQEEEAYDGSNLRALGLAAMRAASAGTSDQLLVKQFGLKPEVIQKLRQYNPIVDTIGTIGGIAGSLMVPGGAVAKFLPAKMFATAGLATEAATGRALSAAAQSMKSPAVKSIMQKYIPKAAGSAVEGAFYGTGSFISENALGNPEASGENLFAKAAKYSLEGAAIGAGLTIGGTAFLDGVKKAASSAMKSAPYLAKVMTGVDPEISLAYMSDPLKYDAALTAEQIAEKANNVYKTLESKLNNGLVDLESVNSQLEHLKAQAQNQKGSADKVYASLEKKVNDYTKQELKKISESPVPIELIDEVERGRLLLKEKNNSTDSMIDEVLNGIDQETPLVKGSNFLVKLKQLRSKFFTKSKTEKGKFLPKSIEDEKSLNEINSYIERTQKYIDGGNDYLTLKDYRDYLKKVRKDIDFIGQADYHADTANAILNLYQGYINKNLRAKAPPEFFPLMDELRENTQLSVELARYLRTPDKVQALATKAHKSNPVVLRDRELLQKLDDVTGSYSTTHLDNYANLRSASLFPSEQDKALVGSTSPEFENMLRSGVKSEGLDIFTQSQTKRLESDPLYRELAEELGVLGMPGLPSQAERAKNIEYEILKKNKPYIDENLNKYLEDLTKTLDELDTTSLLKKKRLTTLETEEIKNNLKLIKAFEDVDKAALYIDQKTSGNEKKIKAYFTKLSELSDQDFVEMVDALRVKSAFDKSFTRGSRNVNLFQSIFSSVTGGVSGGFAGGPIGAIAGSVLGGYLGVTVDAYGPMVAKKVLKKLGGLKQGLKASSVYKVFNDELPDFAKVYSNVGLKALKSSEDANKEYNDLIFKSPTDYLRKLGTPVLIKQSNESDFEESKDQVQDWIDQSQVNNETFMEDNDVFNQIAPQTTISFFQTYQRAVEFMRGKVPRGTNDYFDEYEPNEGEKFRFTRYVDYIKDPSIVMKEIQAGFIPTEGIDVIKNVYPNMFQQLVDSVTNSVHDIGIKNIPINKRIEIKTKLGIDLAPNVTPQSFAQLQQNNVDSENIEKVNSKVQQRNQTDMARLTGKA